MTSSADERTVFVASRRHIFLALFIALAVALHTLEALLPSPAPWFRLGFANIFTLTALFLFGPGAAWSVSLTRICLGALVLGNLFAPGFLLALAGGVLATGLMTLARTLAGRHLGPIGISALGAAGHATGQMLVAWLVLVRHPGLWRLYPIFLLFALVTGLANGAAADALLGMLRRHRAFAPDAGPASKVGS